MFQNFRASVLHLIKLTTLFRNPYQMHQFREGSKSPFGVFPAGAGFIQGIRPGCDRPQQLKPRAEQHQTELRS